MDINFNQLITWLLVLGIVISFSVLAKDVILEKTKPIFKQWFGTGEETINVRELKSAKEFLGEYMRLASICYEEKSYGGLCKCSTIQTGRLQKFKIVFVSDVSDTDAYLMPPNYRWDATSLPFSDVLDPFDNDPSPVDFIHSDTLFPKIYSYRVENKIDFLTIGKYSMFNGTEDGITMYFNSHYFTLRSSTAFLMDMESLQLVHVEQQGEAKFITVINPKVKSKETYVLENYKTDDIPLCDDLAVQAASATEFFNSFTKELESCLAQDNYGKSCKCGIFPEISKLSTFGVFFMRDPDPSVDKMMVYLVPPSFSPANDLAGAEPYGYVAKYELDSRFYPKVNGYDTVNEVGSITSSNFILLKNVEGKATVSYGDDASTCLAWEKYPNSPADNFELLHIFSTSMAFGAVNDGKLNRMKGCSEFGPKIEDSRKAFNEFVTMILTSALDNSEVPVVNMPPEAVMLLTNVQGAIPPGEIQIVGSNFPEQGTYTDGFTSPLYYQKLRVVVPSRIDCKARLLETYTPESESFSCLPSIDDCSLCVFSQEFPGGMGGNICMFDRAELKMAKGGGYNNVRLFYKDSLTGDPCNTGKIPGWVYDPARLGTYVDVWGRDVIFVNDENAGPDTGEYVTLKVSGT